MCLIGQKDSSVYNSKNVDQMETKFKTLSGLAQISHLEVAPYYVFLDFLLCLKNGSDNFDFEIYNIYRIMLIGIFYFFLFCETYLVVYIFSNFLFTLLICFTLNLHQGWQIRGTRARAVFTQRPNRPGAGAPGMLGAPAID